MKESVLRLKEKTTYQFSHFQIARKIFYDWPVKYHFWLFWYMLLWFSLVYNSTLFHTLC